MWKVAMVVASVSALTGCQTAPAPAAVSGRTDPGPYPSNLSQIMSQYVRTSFFDPYSIADTALSVPQAGTLPYSAKGSGWIVCLRSNAKNRMGGYTGLKESAYLIQDGSVVDGLGEYSSQICSGKAFSPWRPVY